MRLGLREGGGVCECVYARQGSWGGRGDVHPHLALAHSLSPRTEGGTSRWGSCSRVGQGHSSLGWGREGPCHGHSGPAWSICSVYMGGAGALVPGLGRRGGGSVGNAMPGRGSRPAPCLDRGLGYSLARPMMVRMYRKMLMMSVYRFKAANTYSSGLSDSCLFPSSSWVSTARKQVNSRAPRDA